MKSSYTTKSDFKAMLELWPPTLKILEGGVGGSTTPLRNYLWGLHHAEVLLANKPWIEVDRLATDSCVRGIWFTHLRQNGWSSYIQYDATRATASPPAWKSK